MVIKSSSVTLEVNSIPTLPHAIDVEEEPDKNSRNLEDKATFKTKISLNIYFLTYSLWIYPNTIIKQTHCHAQGHYLCRGSSVHGAL